MTEVGKVAQSPLRPRPPTFASKIHCSATHRSLAAYSIPQPSHGLLTFRTGSVSPKGEEGVASIQPTSGLHCRLPLLGALSSCQPGLTWISKRGGSSGYILPPFLSTMDSAEMLPWDFLGPLPAQATAGFLGSYGQL